MQEFDLLRNITIGQYLPTGSVVHRLDPRAKLLAAAVLITAIAVTTSYLAQGLLLLAVVGILLLARIPLGYALRGVRPALPFLLVLALVQLLFFGRSLDPSSPVLWEYGFVVITQATVKAIVISFLRLVALILLASAVTFSTAVTELSHGIEGLLRPFRRLRVPAHELALIVTIALRFVPTFAQELERIMKAQVSRGADFGGGGRFNFVRRTVSLLPLLVPLFTIALERAEELVLAMEARGYVGGQDRSSLVELRARWRDVLAVAATLALAVLVVAVRWPF